MFQSTLPVKGATRSRLYLLFLLRVSIHAPSEGSDPAMRLFQFSNLEFQSTLPVKGATSACWPRLSMPGFNPRSQ